MSETMSERLARVLEPYAGDGEYDFVHGAIASSGLMPAMSLPTLLNDLDREFCPDWDTVGPLRPGEVRLEVEPNYTTYDADYIFVRIRFEEE